jgi:hypothetical protein
MLLVPPIGRKADPLSLFLPSVLSRPTFPDTGCLQTEYGDENRVRREPSGDSMDLSSNRERAGPARVPKHVSHCGSISARFHAGAAG